MIECIWSDYFDKSIECDKELNCEGCDVLKYIHGQMASIFLEEYKKNGNSKFIPDNIMEV
jgi:hypothetical protein